jgi:hypothetical protein
MNEPDSSFSQCYQEGMTVPIAQRSTLVQALHGALADRAPWAGVMADESSHVWQFVPEAGRWLNASGTPRRRTRRCTRRWSAPRRGTG